MCCIFLKKGKLKQTQPQAAKNSNQFLTRKIAYARDFYFNTFKLLNL